MAFTDERWLSEDEIRNGRHSAIDFVTGYSLVEGAVAVGANQIAGFAVWQLLLQSVGEVSSDHIVSGDRLATHDHAGTGCEEYEGLPLAETHHATLGLHIRDSA